MPPYLTEKYLKKVRGLQVSLGLKKVESFDFETALEERGGNYEKNLIPMTSKVVVDGNLITGQNPFSSKEMAEVVMQQLDGKNNVN